MRLFLAICCCWPLVVSAGHWSLQPVANPAPPKIAAVDWPRTDLDRFLLAEWERAGLRPGQDADRLTLIRRIFFTLIGLPPTPADLDRYADLPLERLVDDLLASPRFGEKWGRHWLDLARYADSNGKDRDVVFPHAWRYRNHVIASFNADQPFNQFIREQVAGDLLPDTSDEMTIATAFLALGPKAFQETDPEKFRLDVVDEEIDVLTRSVLGLTVSCARCHDHKFDPVSTADYYALAGIFLSSDTRYGPGPLYVNRHDKDTPLVPIGSNASALHGPVADWNSRIIELTEFVTDTRSAAYRIRRQITGELRDRGLSKPEDAPDLLELHRKCEAMYAEAASKNEERKSLIESPPARQPGYTMAVLRRTEMPEDCQIRKRGVPGEKGPTVARGRLDIPGMPALDEIGTGESGRRQLADWLVHPDNPLTARVLVNRVWHHLFGRGIVATVDNLGVSGGLPSHPELLDFLASEFMADGWSVKRLIRRIVLGRTWQLSSQADPEQDRIDPDNLLWTHAAFRRLDVEAFRDAVLTASGQLLMEPPAGSLVGDIYPGMDYGDGDNSAQVRADIAAFRHRTVYLPVIRNEMPEVLQLFDFADPNLAEGARNSRTIPSQALFLMNSPFMEDQARFAAKRILGTAPGSRIDFAYRLTVARPPSQAARQSIAAYVTGRALESNEEEAWTDVFLSLFSSSRFRYLD